MSITTEAIRNIAIAGHGTTGKTTIVESLLFASGAIARAESIDSGKTVCDYTDEEVSNKFSIHASLAHTTWKDQKVNLLDTPGAADFVGEVVAAFRACESAMVVVAARAGVQIETIKLWRRLDERNMPRFVVVNKMDEERAEFASAVADLTAKFSKTFVPLTIPMGNGSDYTGVINLIDEKAYVAPELPDWLFS